MGMGSLRTQVNSPRLKMKSEKESCGLGGGGQLPLPWGSWGESWALTRGAGVG